ncbi:MAG: glycoside hydrolase family 44 protein [Acidimicrobiales bacterium]
MRNNRRGGAAGRIWSLGACAALGGALALPSAAQSIPAGGPRPNAASTVTFVINTAAGHRAISPLIYGINLDKTVDPSQFAAVMAEARPGMIRMGGNRWTAYNWENNDSNAGSDYEYENDDFLSSSTKPGAAVLATVLAAEKAHIPILLTIPIAGYVSADREPPGPVQDSGPNYLKTRFKIDEPRDPRRLTTTPDTHVDFVYQNQFVYWLRHAAPRATVMFSLDNEPDLWDSTHAEIHPAPTTYAEVASKDLAYASAVKGVDPEALVTGPVSYGWEGYETLQNAPDSAKGGNFLDWYMRQVRAADKAARRVLVNDLDLHWYPEATGDGVRITTTDTAPAVAVAREQAPRSLWDAGYVEDSWITQDSLGGKGIDLIPRLDGQIARNNPGMNLDITEWNYGAGQAISGGIATADVLGIFGRYGVHAADLWPLNPSEAYNYGAFAMYRNYDGRGSGFGNTEVEATTTDKVETSVYGSIETGDTGHVVIVAINKSLHTTTARIELKGDSSSSAAVYTLTAAASTPKRAAGLAATGTDTFSYAMPAQSVSVIVPTSSPARSLVCSVGTLQHSQNRPGRSIAHPAGPLACRRSRPAS